MVLNRKNETMSDADFLKEIIPKKARINTEDEFEQFFKFIFNNISDGISILDAELNILGVNYLMEQWFSHKLPFIGQKCYKIYHNRDKPCINCPTLKTIKQRKTTMSIMPYNEPNCEKNWHELYSFPLYNKKNEVVAIIEYIKNISEKKNYTKAVDRLKERLNFQTQTLSDQEIALRVLIEQSRKVESKISENIISNINNSIKPIINSLKSRLKGKEEAHYVAMLEKRLENIVSPFMKKITSGVYGLTPSEIEVASLVREGKKNKEIARIMYVTIKTVCFHRMNIRKKLKLVNSKTNLQTYFLKLN